MLTLNRMDLADFLTPLDLVNEIFNQNSHLTYPIPIKDIAKAAGIIEISAEFPEGFPSSIEGMLVSDSEKMSGYIYADNSKTHERHRFTIAHELGHFLLPSHNPNQSCSSSDLQSRKNIIEREANEFASELLLPSHLLESYSSPPLPCFHFIATMSKEFQTSFEFTANKICNFYDWSAALVYLNPNGEVRYIWGAKSISRKMIIKKGDNVYDKLMNPEIENQISISRTVLPNTWFTESNLGEEDIVCEQIYHQSRGYKVVMIHLTASLSNRA